jgi:signal transduction histidine kinase
MELLTNLLEWSRSQSGSSNFEPDVMNLEKLVRDVTTTFRATARQKGVKMKLDLTPGVELMADQYMISTVLRNLVSNAIKFTNANGRVTIRTEKADDCIRVIVGDTGVGIHQEDLEKIFCVDCNHSTPGTEQESGTGLGLLLCQEFVEKHGGQIWVESEIGKGSEFKFTIPVTEELKKND